MHTLRWLPVMLGLLLLATLGALAQTRGADARSDAGVLPADAQGQALNLDFETGTLKDWQADGEAFVGQPIAGDTVHPRRGDMHSRHAGQFWVGGYERKGDGPVGTLTSRPFRVSKPFARFLVAGGASLATRVELVRADTGETIFRTTGDDTEDLKPVAVDLSEQLGRDLIIRLVDENRGDWGHVNFDDFRLFDRKPVVPPRPSVASPDVFAHEGLAPAEAAKAMTVPEGFHVTLFAGEPDVVQPIAQAIDDRGRLWVAEAYSYPRRLPDAEAQDRILIFEDRDGDGHFDTRKIFADRLNLVSGLEIGFGGVWVGAAPYLLFIPDRDGDDHPDGEPQILLDGWGYQDTHETLNSFTWGPDAWLYGCHGVFTHSKVGKPGTPEARRTPINAGIWRYHPTRHEFEVFARGTSNPWGIDFDEHGQAFLTACVIPHLYHVIQGARYERQAGRDFNPYTYVEITTIADHRHYVGANPHGGNGRSDSAGGGHAHAGAMVYLGGSWPESYRGSIFMNNIHGARLNRDVLEPRGSGFVGHHAPDFLLANDRWSQIVNLKYGPDGNVYLIDWYDKNQCHRNETEIHDRTNGRIFKVSHGKGRASAVNLAKMSSHELVGTLKNPNEWHARHALRLLQERGADREVQRELADVLLNDRSEHDRLRALWALHVSSGLDDRMIAAGLKDESPYVRAWTVQLVTEQHDLSPQTHARFAEMARSDGSPVVRLYLASALQRLKPAERWGILEALMQHGEDRDDPNLPQMVWYAAEPLPEIDMDRGLTLAMNSRLAEVGGMLQRRIAALGTPEAIRALVREMGQSQDAAQQLGLLNNLTWALAGRRQIAMPDAWPAIYARLTNSPDAEVRSQATALGLKFGDPAARAALRALLSDSSASINRRRGALDALVKAHDPDLAPVLQSLVSVTALRAEALRALAEYDDPRTPQILLSTYGQLTPSERRDALNTLASRASYAQALLDAVGAKRIAATDLSADVIRQLQHLKNADVDARIQQVWGTVRQTPAEKAKLIADYKRRLSYKPFTAPDAMLGRSVFVKTCQQCHTLFGVGGRVGPDLTGSNRADLDYILSNVLDPSALIGKDYQAQIISTRGGRVLTGIIRAEDQEAITLVSANETITIPKAEVEERRLSEQSMMPDDLWKQLSDHEVRSLLDYLDSPAQVPALATAENVSGFFNGRDLTGWLGRPDLWSVENGEIVGQTTGLDRNEFLLSDLAAQSFRLTLRVKLVNNQGNSGVQFRSQILPQGEVRGYQADIGPGWWGKLYEENGRGLLWSQSGEPFVQPGEWNTYEIVASGAKIQTYLNGHLCADLSDSGAPPRGIFAFQLHAGGPTEVRFKDLKLEVLPPEGEKPNNEQER